MSKPQNFSVEQNGLLKRMLREYVVREGNLSQEALRSRLQGMGGAPPGQQSLSTFLRREGTGVTYSTATQVALLLGYAGVDELFEEHGLGPDRRNPGTPTDRFPNRVRAARLARWLDCSDTAVQYVETDPFYQNPDLATRRVPWWVDRMRERTLEEIRDGHEHAIQAGMRHERRVRASKAKSEPASTKRPERADDHDHHARRRKRAS